MGGVVASNYQSTVREEIYNAQRVGNSQSALHTPEPLSITTEALSFMEVNGDC